MGVSLYRKYRPQTFGDVVGQEGAVSVLKHAVMNETVGHAYLFSGPRGCGKTTIARILAKALNCLALNGAEPCGDCANCRAITNGESLDVVEIDGASNNSVDEVRELKSHVALAPFSSKYKIYIIDEVHMLSSGAFNALLKTLEEPPVHVVFIMATTEPQKVPITVRSRCQHIPFHSISTKQITDRLLQICEWEGVTASSEALWEVARQADGALRDALSILEQVINRARGEVKLEDVESALGAGSRSALEQWLINLRQNPGNSYVKLKSMMQEGASSQRVFEELFALIKNMWVAACWPDTVQALDISAQEQKFLSDEGQHWRTEDLRAILTSLVGLITQARLGVRSDILLGIFMLDLVQILNHETAPLPVSTAPSKSVQGQVQNAFSPVILPEVPIEVPIAQPVIQKAASIDILKQTSVADLPRTQDLNWEEIALEKQINLLSTVNESNYVLYCGLLDADLLCSEQRLLLDMRHRYCFEALCLRPQQEWAELKSLYQDGIFLRFQEKMIAVTGPERQDKLGAANSQWSQNSGEQRSSAASTSARSMSSVPSQATASESAVEIPFKDIVNDFARFMGGDLIIVRHEQNFKDTDEMNLDGENESTAANDDE